MLFVYHNNSHFKLLVSEKDSVCVQSSTRCKACGLLIIIVIVRMEETTRMADVLTAFNESSKVAEDIYSNLV